MSELNFTKESLSEILKAIKENGGKELTVAYSSDSVLANSENKRVARLFAEKNEVKLHFHDDKADSPVGEEHATAPETAVSAGTAMVAATAASGEEEDGPTLAEVIEKDADVPEFAIDTEAAPVTGLDESLEPSTPVADEDSNLDEDDPEEESQKEHSKTPKVSQFSLAALTKHRKHIVAAVVGSILVFGTGITLMWFAPSAEVNVTVADKPIQRDQTIVAVANGSLDQEKNQISLNKTEVKETVSGTAKATGKKTVGQKSKGKVTIRNYSVVNDTTLSAGTSLKVLGGEGDGLDFVTVTAVTVPHGTETSSVDNEGTITISNKPGKMDVEVEAAELGKTYNQPSGTRFSVNNQSTKSIDGISSTEIAGGTSEDKQVVTASDQKALADQLKSKAEQQAKQSLTQKIGAGQKLIEDSVKTEVTKQAFDKEVDSEATDFKLDLEVTALGYYYVEDEAKEILRANLEKFLPEGYKLDGESIEYQVELGSALEDRVNLKGGVKATLLPNLGTDNLQKDLVNRPIEEVEEFFKKNESVQEVDIVIQPPYYRSQNKMPLRAENIKVNFKSQ